MTSEKDQQPPQPPQPSLWTPASSSSPRSYLGRLLSIPCYPALLPYAVFKCGENTVENARRWRAAFTMIGLSGSAVLHALVSHLWGGKPKSRKHILAHLALAFSWDHSYVWLTGIAHQLITILRVNRTGNRLRAGRLNGPRVLVVGNGPSAVEGQQLGQQIDKFDEVVRFNNFQTKVAGMEKWVGTKTTVHFTDGLLSPTFSEYHVPGATIVMSLFTDTFMVGGSYIILRAGADLQVSLTLNFMKDPAVTWIDKVDIERLKKLLGLKHVKHPTSGMLAIDYFLNKEGVTLPIYIHGFDFFEGPTMHYFDEHEPLYERINDRIGVNMHSPHLEKIYVEKLIKEGKVKFLKDCPAPAS